MNERRIKRLQEQIKVRIAEILQREVADRKIGMVTITRVELDREFTICNPVPLIMTNSAPAHGHSVLRAQIGVARAQARHTHTHADQLHTCGDH